jgi:hypothetical protein
VVLDWIPEKVVQSQHRESCIDIAVSTRLFVPLSFSDWVTKI